MNDTMQVEVYDRSHTTEYGGYDTYNCTVQVTDDAITVDGKTLPFVYQYNTVFELKKRSIRCSNPEYLVNTLQNNFWISFNTNVCNHVKQYGKAK